MKYLNTDDLNLRIEVIKKNKTASYDYNLSLVAANNLIIENQLTIMEALVTIIDDINHDKNTE